MLFNLSNNLSSVSEPSHVVNLKYLIYATDYIAYAFLTSGIENAIACLWRC